MYMSKLNRDNLTRLRASLMKNAFNLTELTDSTIKGTISMGKDQLLCLSMPYDEGWKVYVDGNLTEAEDWCGGLMAISIPEGDHEVYMKFVPDGLVKGLLLTIFSWMIYIFLWMVIVGRIKLPKIPVLNKGKEADEDGDDSDIEESIQEEVTDDEMETTDIIESKKGQEKKTKNLSF